MKAVVLKAFFDLQDANKPYNEGYLYETENEERFAELVNKGFLAGNSTKETEDTEQEADPQEKEQEQRDDSDKEPEEVEEESELETETKQVKTPRTRKGK